MFGAQPRNQVPVCGRLTTCENFQPVTSGTRKLRYQGPQLGCAHPVLARVRKHGHTARLPDGPKNFFQNWPASLDIAHFPCTQPALEGVLLGAHDSRIHQRTGKMGPAGNSIDRHRPRRLQNRRAAFLLQLSINQERTLGPCLGLASQGVNELRHVPVKVQGNDMQGMLAPLAGNLRAGNEPDACSVCCATGLFQPAQRVVIGKCQYLDTLLRSTADNL